MSNNNVSHVHEPTCPWKVLDSLGILSLVVPLDSQGEGGLLGRGRSRASCRWVTRALSAASSGVISSLAVLGEVILMSA